MLDPHLPWDIVVESGLPVVLHDPLCPLTPVDFIIGAVDAAEADDVVIVGVRPVTDTVRAVDGEGFGGTLDREALRQVTSPIVLPARVVASLSERPPLDFVEAVDALRGFGIRFVDAPPMARRVADADDVRVLEALGAGAH